MAGVLYALAGDGRVFRLALGTLAAPVVASGTEPSFAATGTNLYVSAGLHGDVARVDLSGTPVAEDPYLVVPTEPDADVGVSPLATDCSALWTVRKTTSGPRLHRHDLAQPGSFEPLLLLPVAPIGPMSLAVDTRYAYAAAPNAGGGIFAFDKVSQGVARVYDGNAFALTVDDDGVYFGEHGKQPGAGTMYMLVKK